MPFSFLFFRLLANIGDTLREGLRRLQAAGVPEARRTAEWLLEEATGLRRAALYAYPERPLTAQQGARFDAWLERRSTGEPVQYVLGEAHFCGLRLAVTPDVLIPRPETEEVVAHANGLLAGLARTRVLDAGTGSGCIALALKSARPEADIHAIDVSEAALEVARRNARTLGLAVTFQRADLLAADLPGVPHDLDLLVSNPPYIPDGEASGLERHVRDFEPALALFSGDDPVRFYHAIAYHAAQRVRPGGYVVVETHADYARATAACFGASAFETVEVHRDLSGRPRIVVAQRGRRADD